MTLDYERKGVYLLNESDLDYFVDRALEAQAQLTALLTARDQFVERLKGFSGMLRVDASGEQGRMSATDMYALADLIDSLALLGGSGTAPAQDEKP